MNSTVCWGLNVMVRYSYDSNYKYVVPYTSNLPHNDVGDDLGFCIMLFAQIPRSSPQRVSYQSDVVLDCAASHAEAACHEVCARGTRSKHDGSLQKQGGLAVRILGPKKSRERKDSHAIASGMPLVWGLRTRMQDPAVYVLVWSP